MPRAGTGPLARLFGDVSSFHEAWGREPLLYRGRPNSFDGVLDLDAVDRFVTSSPRRPAVRMVIDGDVLPASQYCSRIRLGGQQLDDVVDVRKVVDRLCDGATLVLQSLHRTVPAVGEFVDALQCDISHPVQANAYLTPPGASGLTDHADDHDVVAVQLHGEKHWHVDGVGDVTLGAGDVLYVPAGTRHRAAASDDTSLHLTLGIIRVTARNVIERVLRSRSESLDRPLPIGYQLPSRAAALTSDVEAAVGAVVEHMSTLDVAAVVEHEQHRQRRRPEAAGHISSMARRHRLTLDGVIRWTAPEPLAKTLERFDRRREPADEDADSPSEIEVHLGDRTVTFPVAATEALRRLSHGTPTRVGDLPGIDDPSRLVLARRLVEESACIIEALGEPTGPARHGLDTAEGGRRISGWRGFRSGGSRVSDLRVRNPTFGSP